MNFAVVGCYIVILQLMLTCSLCSADQPKDENGGESVVKGTCNNVNILMASNASTGIQVILASTEDAKDSPPVNTTVAGHYLPPECRVNHLCDILHFGHPSGTSHYIIPSIGGFVVLSHWADYNNRTEELPWKSFIGVTQNCNPTKAFLARRNQILIVACMNLRSRPKGILHHMYYNLFPNSTGNGWIVERNTDLQTKSETIYNPATVSEIIHVHGQVRCQQRDSLYFIDDAYVLRFPTSDTSDPEFSVSDHPLENCIGYQSFEHYGNDSLVIRCSNNRTAFYDSCGNGRFTYAPDDNIPYPCTNWSTVVYRNGTQLTLDGATQLLPSGDMNYAKCVQGVNRPTFITLSADGSIFITRFDGNNFTKITSGNCSDNIPCPQPVFSENENIFGMFESGSFVIVNVTEGCLDDPVMVQIPIPIVPDLVSVSMGRGTYNCSCSAIQNTEPPSTTQTGSTLEATQTESISMQTDFSRQIESTTTTNPSEPSSSPTKSSTSTFHYQPDPSASSISNIEGQLAGVILASFSAIAIIILTLVSLVFICKFYHLCGTKGKGDLPPNAQSQQESIAVQVAESHMDAINNTVGLYDTESTIESGETTTTTSVSESVEIASSISGGSDCTVSFHPESGPPGGETHVHVPSKDILPFKSRQLDAQLLIEQIQSRTSDNRDREDMDNKVHTFMTEDNDRERNNANNNN